LREFVEAGRLITYGPSSAAAYRQVGVYQGGSSMAQNQSTCRFCSRRSANKSANCQAARLEVPATLLARDGEGDRIRRRDFVLALGVPTRRGTGATWRPVSLGCDGIEEIMPRTATLLID
jgi:hypothetical protein